MDKRATSITKFTIRYIVVVVSLVLATTLLWIFLLWKAVFSTPDNSEVRADSVEKEVETWIINQSEGKLDLDSFPQDADFYYEDKDGNVIESRISEKTEADFLSEISKMKENDFGKDVKGQEIYLRYNNMDNLFFIHYSLALPFEWLIFACMLVLYIFDFVVPTVLFVTKIKKNIKMVKTYASDLGEQNLSVTSISTEIKELNEVTETMEMMRRELQSTMEAQWADEQKKKDTMAQIAHDLKTPLTIIRGNAELLSERSLSDEEKEALATIINNCERIAQSILDIISM